MVLLLRRRYPIFMNEAESTRNFNSEINQYSQTGCLTQPTVRTTGVDVERDTLET